LTSDDDINKILVTIFITLGNQWNAASRPYNSAASNSFQVAIDCESVAEIDRLFAALGQGGTVRMPLGDVPWGARFGMLTDQFGIQWLLNCYLAK
jgi:uncharacterized glyoxalase superfamily protein PhnB